MKNLLTEQLKTMLSYEFTEPLNAAFASLEDCQVRFIRRMFDEGTPVLCVLRSPDEVSREPGENEDDPDRIIYFDNYWLDFWSFWCGRFSKALNHKLDLYEAIVDAQPELSPMLTPEIDYYKERFSGSRPRGECLLEGGVYVGNFVITPSEAVAKECLSQRFFKNLSISQKVCFAQSFRPLVVPPDISFEKSHSLRDQLTHWMEQGKSINPFRSSAQIAVFPSRKPQLSVIQGGKS